MKYLTTTLLLALAVILFSPNTFALECYGTQPNWNATLSGTEAVIEDHNNKTTVVKLTDVSGAAGYSPEYLRIYSANTGAVAIANRTDRCTDGETKRLYPYEVIFVGKKKLYGCCDDSPVR